jgi:CP family cyanate transporter-like MFS transporter
VVTTPRPLPLWAGRTLALVSVVLIALSLRSAVTAISPIVAEIRQDIPLTAVGIGMIGTLPPIFFAVSGIVGPIAAKRFGLEGAVLISAVVMVVGHFVRAGAGSFAVLLASTAVTLLGMGVCNVLLPPVVKRYFPDRIGWVTALYATIMSISTALPSLLAVPVSEALGWRFSLAIWGAVAATAILPWSLMLARRRRDNAARALDDDPDLEVSEPALTARLWRSRTAIAIAITFSVSSLSAYAAFAWLPQILVDIVGVTPAVAGSLLSIFAIAGLPASIVAPILVARLRNSSGIILAGVLFFVVGYIGLLVAPTTLTALWVLLIGLGPILFPVCLVLINTRTRSHVGAVALSGFAQTIGYTLGATGPLLVGVLHEFSGGWTVPLIFLLATSLAGIYGAIVLSRPGYVEDELDRASR